MASDTIPLVPGAYALLIVSIFMTVFATVCVALRFYARHLKSINPLPEDWLAVLALVTLYVCTALVCATTFVAGTGHHAWDLTPEQLRTGFHISVGVQFVFPIGMGIVKVSLCMMVARIFSIQPYKSAAWVAAGLSVAWSIACLLVNLFVCKPISMFWDPTQPGGHCGDENKAYLATGIVDVLVDLFILLIPMPMLMKLQMPLSNKLALAGIFTLGVFTMIVACFRFISILRLNFRDASHDGLVSNLLTILELSVAIIISCSAAMRPVFGKVFQSISMSRISRRNRSTAVDTQKEVYEEQMPWTGRSENTRNVRIYSGARKSSY